MNKMSIEFEKELGTRSFDDIVEYTLQSIVQKNVGLSNVNEGSVLRSLIEVLSENEDTANYYIELVYRCMDIDNCYGEELDRSAKILGLTREPAKSAIGEITLSTGDNPAEYDIEIPYNFIVSTRPNKNGDVTEFYISESNKIIKAGESSVNVAVTCVEPGQIYVPAGSITVLSSSLQGIHSVINESSINGGRDVEGDEDFRERIHNVREGFGKCTDMAIESAVSEVSGVVDANVIDMYDGVATTGIVIMTDTTLPPDSVKEEIISVVNATKASGIKPYIIYAETIYVDINVNVNSDIEINDLSISKIKDAIRSYCTSLEIGQSLIIKQLERKILNSVDTTDADNDNVDIETVSPTENIQCSNIQVIRAGNITINGITVDE